MQWVLKFVFYAAVFAIADSLTEKFLGPEWWFMVGWVAGGVVLSLGVALDAALTDERRGEGKL